MSTDIDLRKTIERSFKDPIAAVLLKNSNITTIQYESLIIEYVSEYLSDNKLNYSNKAFLRSKKVSRGSFGRTLAQGRQNIISSIFTILLLFYIGIFDTPPFEEYRDLAEKLSEYIDLIENTEEPKAKQFLNRMEEEMKRGIQSLVRPKSLGSM